MSVCSNTFRAYSRSRLPPSKTLLPFLYQTPTIQQWQPATRPIARRTIASRSPRNNGDSIPFSHGSADIPFEDGNLPPAIDQEPPRKTTITGSERAAFQKLYKKFNADGRHQKDKDNVEEVDQVADEYYEEDEDTSKPSLDQVFDEVLKGEPRTRMLRTRAQRQKTTGDGTGQDERTAKLEELDKAQGRSKKGTKADTAQFKEIRLAERERIDKLIRNAPTDRALWQVLESEVFEKVGGLDLDNTNTDTGSKDQAPKPSTAQKKTSKNSSKLKPDPPTVNARILFQNYPHHLITALHTLRLEFPSSTLPFAILPTIKSLGRSAHALGATPVLYRHLIRTAWIQQASYTSVDTLLSEMDDTAIEFDADVLAVLDGIIKEHNAARSGLLGREMQMVYGMEMWIEGIKKIKDWKNDLAQRLGMASQGKRDGDIVVRRVVQEKKESLWRSVDPAKKSGVRKQDGARDHVPLVEGVNMAEDVFGVEGERAHGRDTHTSAIESLDKQPSRDHDDSRPAKILL
jgi:hypothetical protein